MAAGRSPVSRRRRWTGIRRKSPTPPHPPSSPLPLGAEVEVRVDDDAFHGSWFEASLLDFLPARGCRSPARYAVSYSHLAADDGGPLVEQFVLSCVRPRPPPPAGPRFFLLHDIVEAFLRGGWWSGIVVAAADSVTVAFPITREVIAFAPRFVRPRRDYVDGDWVPSRAAIAVWPNSAVRVYEVHDKVEVLREREVDGGCYSWFPATVVNVIDTLSYIVEYLDQEEGNGGEKKETEYLHCRFIRPAVEHSPFPGGEIRSGAAVEAYCDGAWWPGVVRRVVGEGEYVVRLNGKGAEQLVTKVMELLRPQYTWDGNHWRIVTANKRRANLRWQSANGKRPISHVEVAFCDDEQNSYDPESSTTKKSRKEPELPDTILSGASERASVIEMNTYLSSSCKSPENNNYLNCCSQLSVNNSLQDLSHKIVSACSVAVSRLPFTSLGHSTPSCQLIPNVGEASINHEFLYNAVLPKKKEGQTHHVLPLHGKSDSSDDVHTQLKGSNNFTSTESNCALSASARSLETSVLTSKVSTVTNRASSIKVYVSRKLAKKKALEVQHSPQGSMDATSTVQERASSNKLVGQTKLSSLALKDTKSQTQQQPERPLEDTSNINKVTNQELLPLVPLDIEPMHNEKGIDIHASLLEEEPPAMINRSIHQENRNAYVPIDSAATQVAKSNRLTEKSTLSLDRLFQLDGGIVDERSNLLHRQNAQNSQGTTDILRSCSLARCSTPLHLATSQNTDQQVPFIKRSPMWPVIEALDVFKELPQRPHFLPLQEFPPALREGMALGLMSTFDLLVENLRKASIGDSLASFKENIKTLCHLKKNGFNVQSLQCYLIKLFKIKSDHVKRVEEKNKVKAQMLEKETTMSRINSMFDASDRAIAEQEKTLAKLCWKRKEIAKEKEYEGMKLSRLKAADRSLEDACGDAEQEFRNILDELQRKTLT
ncbi:hypothetical protein EJB05_51303, partial [Eragrostis curvula]